MNAHNQRKLERLTLSSEQNAFPNTHFEHPVGDAPQFERRQPPQGHL
ncbi:hypothetical protein RISK_006091 [Rhodopirellula islandica]|uniref:Uncharacterized protein n=1 Tax=Rhodopirellula islandica TaxID=595434 RepID=A0A0J1B5B7_RHOIS|nr:hypothetical protein RISK_006091 [Rhodopirellula islandica]